MAKILVSEVTFPAAWCSALVNGDTSGLNEADVAAFEKNVADLARDGWQVVDVVRDENGEAQEPRFSWCYDLYGSTAQGGELLDYVVHKRA